MKCLAIVGTTTQILEKKEDFKLTHQDVYILGLHPTKKCDGKFVHNALEEDGKKVGQFSSIIIDSGVEMKCGTRLYKENHASTRIIQDLDHKLSLLMEHTLEPREDWKRYREKLSKTRNATKQTELAAISPPSQRSKARYMDIKDFVYWPEKLWQSKVEGRLNSIPSERYEKYFGWVEVFKEPLFEWQFMYEVVNMIKKFNHEYGLSKDMFNYLSVFFNGAKIEREGLKKFVNEALRLVNEEVEKLDEEEVSLASTTVLESIFGKYKEINSKSKGISGNVLSMMTFTGDKITEDQVILSMERTPVKLAFKWIKVKVGETVSGLRKQFFGSKGTKFDTLKICQI